MFKLPPKPYPKETGEVEVMLMRFRQKCKYKAPYMWRRKAA